MDSKDFWNEMPRSELKKRDQKYRYTCVHCVSASCPSPRVMSSLLSVMLKHGLISLLTAKDKDGDIPLQSAVRSNVRPVIVKLLLDGEGTELKCNMLKAANKKGHVPLKTAFDMQRWPIVEVLLEECIKNDILAQLTGVGEPTVTKASSTLLHKAMKRGYVEYLRIFIKICRKCGVRCLPALLIRDKANCTPWFYLLQQKREIVEEVFKVLKEFNIDINKLYCDKGGKQYIPHVMCRSRNDLLDLWENFDGRMDLKDGYKQKPAERIRMVLLESRPPSPSDMREDLEQRNDNKEDNQLV